MATATAALTVSASNAWTNGAGTYAQPIPSAPASLSAVAISGTQINLGLTSAPIAATQTEWSYKTTASPTWLVLSTTTPVVVSLNVTGLTVATSYDFRARYNGLNGFSAYSPTTTTSTVVAPSVPVMTTLNVVSSTSISGGLTAFPANATSVTIQRDTNAGFTAPVTVTTLNTPNTTFTDTALTASTTYYYRASATGAGGTSGYSSIVSGTTSAAGVWQLATGHYLGAFMPLLAVFPRPDSETGTYVSNTVTAKNRYAYYDGVTSVTQSFAVSVQGGSWPHWFELIAGPAGSAISNGWTKDTHGVFTFTPTAAIANTSPATVVVRVHGQDGSTLDITWTVATSSSTNDFMFLSPSGNNANAGTIGSPKQTLAAAWGTTTAATTFPYRQVYLRAGSYASVSHSDSGLTGAAQLLAGKKPLVYQAYPGETVTIDWSGGECIVNGSDFYFGGSPGNQLTITGSSTAAAETHNFWGYTVDRVNFQWVTFDGFIARVAGVETNSAPIHTSSGTRRNYWGHHGVIEINRVGGNNGNDMAIHCHFCLNNSVTHWCSFTGVSTQGPTYKDSTTNISMRSSYCNRTLAPASDNSYKNFVIVGQTEGDHCEITHCSGIGGAIILNDHGDATNTAMWSARNTIYRPDNNTQPGVYANGGTNMNSINDVIVSKGPSNTTGLTTVSGTECHFAWLTSPPGTNPPINTSTLTLVDNAGNTYRTKYLGIRGAEIA